MTTTLPAPPTTPLPAPDTERWRPLRAGLQNVWQYDHATRFVFHAGRLLLRGRNGAGKTKAVEVLLPFLLEGRLDPARLDPFRTRSRKMHYNLLHEANRDLSTNVGYVWLEFGRLDADGEPRYATVGAGLKARRSDDRVDTWFFVASGRRIDVDLHLVDHDRRPLARGTLADALGEDGRVYESQRDYRAAVNRTLFGMPEPSYEALVEALLRLRQPHLSERLDPAQVGLVLGDSLPPLDADKVHEVAEGFERLESHRRELADRARSLEAVEAFLDAYRRYAATVTAVRARELTSADSQVRKAAEQITAAEQAHADAETRVTALAAEREQVTRDQTATATRIHTLENSKEYEAVRELEAAEAAESAAADRADKAADRRDADAKAAEAAASARDDAEAAATAQRETVEAAGRAAQAAAARADLTGDHAALTAQVEAALAGANGPAGARDGARGTARSLHEQRVAAIAELRERQAAVAAAERAEDRARERADDLAETERAAREAVTAAADAVAAAREAFGDAVETWAGEAHTCALDEADVAALLDAEPAEAAALARERSAPARDRLDAAAADLAAQRAGLARGREQVAAERDDLAGRTHEPPRPPEWRTAGRAGRAGAPLYLLAEPTDALDPATQARVEAALEAAGLLDAWVTPDGRVLGADTLDAALVAGPPADGHTLADVLAPTPHGGVDAEVVAAVLARIRLVEADATPESAEQAAWVATDGRFGIGPLRGAAHADEVRYLGETARAQARARRLAELDARLADLDADDVRLAAERADVDARRAALEAELAAFPGDAGVRDAEAETRAAATALGRARDDLTARRAALAEAEAAAEQARRNRDAVASEHGLAAHVDRLDELSAATADWKGDVAGWLAAAELLLERLAWLARTQAAAAQAVARAAASAEEAAAAEDERADVAERADTLRGMVGAEHEQVIEDLRAARARKGELDVRANELVEEVAEAREARAVAASDLEHARAEHARVEEVRARAAADVRGLGELGVLQVVLDRDLDEPAGWGLRATLDHAREAAKSGPRVADDSDEARRQIETAENQINRRHQELMRDLVAGIRLFARKDHGVLVHDVQYGGRTFGLPGLVAELRDDVAERKQRLDGDEQALLETFLAGELHEHLRGRIRDAADLVAAMNDQLAACPTASGQRIRLRWEVGDDAPPGTQAAVDLLLKGAGLLTSGQREELRAFLHERLREAREGDAAASLHERISAAFDYRRWHAFTIMVRDAHATSWRKLTRQSHATGSGGEKAVMLHLPLFAAMAAHYKASAHAPRLIVLDEVFAGIDRGTRGQLMGLLVALDLDALLTSHEEWGFYAELDGISTYHLVRDPDVAGVLTEWFVWDGATRWELEG